MITNDIARAEYTADGEQTEFAFGGKLFGSGELAVYVDGAEVDAGYAGTLNKLFFTATAEGGDWANGANISFYKRVSSGGGIVSDVLQTIEAEKLIIIVRRLAYEQTLKLRDTGTVPAAALEKALDILTALLIDINTRLQRRLHSPIADSAEIDLELPGAQERAGKYAAFDSAGNVIATNGPAGDTEIPASTYGAQLIAAASAEAARTLLELTSSTISAAMQSGEPSGAGLYLVTNPVSHRTNLFYKDGHGNKRQLTTWTTDLNVAGELLLLGVVTTGSSFYSQIISGKKTFNAHVIFASTSSFVGATSLYNVSQLKLPQGAPAVPEVGHIWMESE